MNSLNPQQWASRAGAAAQGGDIPGALRILDEARQAYPQEAGLWHFTGKMLLQSGDHAAAAEHFGKAFALLPGNPNFAIDQAIALAAAGDDLAALKVLDRIEAECRDLPVYCSTRAMSERNIGELAAAAHWYDRALARDPKRPKALLGRARVALERGESDAVPRFDQTLQVDPGNPYVWLGKAQSLDVAGDVAGARTITRQIVEQAPQFTDALFFLAQLRRAVDEEDYTSHYADAAAKVPQDPNIPEAWARTLGGMDRSSEAADVAAEARKRFPHIERFALLEAIYAGADGQNDRAEAIYEGLDIETSERFLHEARHRTRRGEFDRAAELLDRTQELDPDEISAWALREFVWRLTDDPRHEWLHGQQGLHDLHPLHDADRVLSPAIALLHQLHDNSPLPLGQSLRGGTQTRGQLFDRQEPAFQDLRAAIEATLEEYRRGLPPLDERHPLLRHRDKKWRIAGSWSVRLTGGGDFHASHIHPKGVVSSALYCELPESFGKGDDKLEGALEIGRPPPNLQLDMPPRRVIEPRVGHLALFPSTLYHGTRPFTDGRRMTVAFDVVLDSR
ncbi:tetratricopeptide repeat protein [Aurantiacibacter gilvus]|uniref:Tetratricopeptide repeat protein n=1 Tax=Aurantiacibacter gilvus TaxID=3139141 RepID=A0ABU9IDJ8_9SPHN